MTETTGAVVVLIPSLNDIPSVVDGGQHVTLAYFGDENLSDADFDDLLDVISDVVSSEVFYNTELKVKEEAWFGEEKEAHVLTMDASPRSIAVILRKRLLGKLTPSLMRIFKTSETFPRYQPHLTIGYLTEGYSPVEFDIPETINIEGVGVWNGETRIVFPLRDVVDELAHIGVARKSGRYPWGSGENPNQHNKEFLDYVDDLHKQGMSQKDIATGLGMSVFDLRAKKSIARNEQRKADQAEALRLKDKGMSNVAIGIRMGRNESVVRELLNPAIVERANVLNVTAEFLKDQVAEKGLIDIGSGVENNIGISQTKLATAVSKLKEEGYEVHKIKVEQLGTGKQTTVKVLGPPGTTYGDVVKNPDKIRSATGYTEDSGRSFLGLLPPQSVDSKRVAVRYAEEGGTDADGVIYLRRGVPELSLGNARYAQVRIAVDDSHYLKGMVMYKDDLPPGVDLLFNTSKSNTGNKLDAMKPMKDDEDNPFGSVVRQRHYFDADGNRKLSPLNIVGSQNQDGETSSGVEGGWALWSRNLSSQMLSKQQPSLARTQLGLTYDAKKAEYDEIMSLTNPAVRKKLLMSFADGADSSAVHLKAAAMPRQSTHVILPINSMKETEIYAPNFRNGERVALVRYPHGGTFEIPELTVNNRNVEAKKTLGRAIDAVGINHKVAQLLSGADFDGDTVLVIPNNAGLVKSSPPLAALKDFDPKTAYPKYEGMVPMSAQSKGLHMGNVSNLITDMTIRGANHAEIARAVRHSMVVIDAEKHKLNYKQSAIDNGIAELKKRYQGGPTKGAATLISLASSEERVLARKDRTVAKGGPIDPATGKRMYEETGKSYTTQKGNVVYKYDRSTKMAETDDAHTLSSGKYIEAVYADHANKLKALANSARKAALNTPPLAYSPSAKVAYSKEVSSLNAKLNIARKNKPQERQAQLLANTIVATKRRANPDLEKAEIKKIKGQALYEARTRTGAKKQRVEITPAEWAAIQAGAISNSKLVDILAEADLDQVKALATPRQATVMTAPTLARVKSMLNAGYDQAEIADALGIATSTINAAIVREG